MSAKSIGTVIVSLAVFIGILLIATRVPSSTETNALTAAATARLSVSEPRFDFGTVSMANGIVHKRVAVKNEGPDSVVIGKMYTSCMCTTASFIKGNDTFGPFGMQGHGYIPSISQTLGASEEAAVDIAFDPAAHGPAGVGRVDRSVYLENNAGKPVEIQFTATVTP